MDVESLGWFTSRGRSSRSFVVAIRRVMNMGPLEEIRSSSDRTRRYEIVGVARGIERARRTERNTAG